MAEKAKKDREVKLGGIVVGTIRSEDRAFVPSETQPPEDVTSDFRAVERWLTRNGVAGEHVLARAYVKKILVKEVRSHTSALVD